MPALSPWTFESDLAAVAPEAALEPAARPQEERIHVGGHSIRHVTGEFWTAGQRQASSLHEVSYRACFKPQLPAYFIRRYSKPGDIIYDPFSGRGTTAIEAALLGRRIIANDVNPLSRLLAQPRLHCPAIGDIEARLQAIPYLDNLRADIDLSMFYAARTEAEIVSLRNYLRAQRHCGLEDAVDGWIRMVATNRLSGHSPGFFSVYSLPPNQAASAVSQQRINLKRGQQPEYRDTRKLILRKSRQLLKKLGAAERQNLRSAARDARFITGPAGDTDSIADESVQLTVTSPPFLDVVQYAEDNWLRGWFNDLPVKDVAAGITMARNSESWSAAMAPVFAQLFRITRPGGVVAFEVGEVRKGSIKLEESVIPLGLAVGFQCQAVLINQQRFTKTANIWGVSNNAAGTNSNRIVVFSKA